MSKYLFTSERLGFRDWTETDFNALYNLCQDKRVMEFFPELPDEERIHAAIKKFNAYQAQYSFTFWAVELLNTNEFIGFIGRAPVLDLPFAPTTEIGWRLAYKHWNKGYAKEGAKACLNYGFNHLNLEKIVSFTATVNKRSEALMQKIGMTQIGEFGHPKVDKDNWLHQHVLYEIKNEN